jgi:hypothetical protein
LLLPHAWAGSEGHLNLVIAIDLTKSVDVAGPDGKTEFRKNVDGVMGILANIPAGAHVTIIGITDRSFAQPYMLMSASISDDSGYFGERLGNARNQLVARWKVRSSTLKPDFGETDILGALQLASQVFAQDPGAKHRILVFFSDMRNSTRELNLEGSVSLNDIGVEGRDRYQENLHGVSAYVLGVDGFSKSSRYWINLNRFWQHHLASDGATVLEFSALRSGPRFE